MSGYVDGNFVGQFLSKNIVSYPLADKPLNAGVMAFDLTYYQYANTYAAANVGSADTNAPLANLYAQSPVERVGAGVVKYTRSYIQQPVTWYDMEQVQYAYPGLDSGVGTANWIAFGARSALVVQKLATVERKYVINANIPYANVASVSIVTLSGQPINRIGQAYFGSNILTVPNTDYQTWVISSDPQRWKGNLWEITTKTVGYPNVFFP